MSATLKQQSYTETCDTCGKKTAYIILIAGVQSCFNCYNKTDNTSAICEYCGIEDDTVEDVEDLYSERLIPTCARCQADTVVKDARA